MLSKALLLCFSVALVGVGARKFDLTQHVRRNLGSEFTQQTDVSLKLQALKLQRYLSSLPAQCALTHWATVQEAEVEALKNYHKCNTKVILKNIGMIVVDIGEFALSIYALGSNAVAEVVACINPVNWFFCILSAPKQLTTDVKGIISEVKSFYSQAKTLIPRIVKGINQCFHDTSSDYQQLLDGIEDVAKTCNADFVH